MEPKNINRLLIGLLIFVLVGGTITWIILSVGSQKCSCKSGFKCKEGGCEVLCALGEVGCDPLPCPADRIIRNADGTAGGCCNVGTYPMNDGTCAPECASGVEPTAEAPCVKFKKTLPA